MQPFWHVLIASSVDLSMPTIQDIIALGLVGWAVTHLAQRVWRFAVRGSAGGCMGCKSCPSAKPPRLLSLGGLDDPRRPA